MKTTEIIARRNHRARKRNKSGKILSALRMMAFSGIILGIVFLGFIGFRYALITQKLPPIDHFERLVSERSAPTQIFDRTNEHLLLSLNYPTLQSELLKIDALDQPGLSNNLIRVVIASKEPDFWTSSGADWSEITNPQPATIAEELVQTVYPDSLGENTEKAILTKILAYQVTKQFGQKQILEWYLNSAYFGQLAFGADAAAKTYLDKSASDLDLSESILLSAILNAPALNPIDSQGAMRDSYLAEVNKLAASQAFSEPEIQQAQHTNFVIFEPPALEAEIQNNPVLQKTLTSAYDIVGQETFEKGGYIVRSTLDYDLQMLLECLTGLSSESNTASEGNPCPLYGSETLEDDLETEIRQTLQQSAISAAVLEIKSGNIIAAIDIGRNAGSQREANRNFTPREPGSTLTPFVALAAYTRGISPSTMVWDLADQAYYLPAGYQNTQGNLFGPIRLRTALTEDVMGPLAELLRNIGTAPVWNQAQQFGLSNLNAKTSENVLFEGGAVTADVLANAYIPFANQGRVSGTVYNDIPRPRTIMTIESPDKIENSGQERTSISLLDQNLAYLMLHTLTEDKQAYRYFNRPAGTKTGIVAGKGDFWMIGFTPEIMTIVWVGAEDDAYHTAQETREAAISLWQTLMEAAVKNQPVNGWNRPEKVSQLMVCTPSGKIPTAVCPETVSEVFLAGNEPVENDDLYIGIPINQVSLRMATTYTTFGNVLNKTYLNIPQEAEEWAADNQIDMVPKEYDPIPLNKNTAVSIYEPLNFSSFSKSGETSNPIEIKAEIDVSEPIRYVQVAIGKGFYPEQWRDINVAADLITNGRWTLAAMDLSTLDAGLYDIRVSVVTDDQKFYRTDQYINIRD